MLTLLRARLRAGGDDGIAMVMVIGISAVLALLMVAAVSFAVGGLQKSGNDRDWNAALAAAYAGIEEYQSRLADDPDYLRYGNPASEFSNPDGGAAGVELPPAGQENPAFGLGATGTWATVAGSDGEAQFRYEVSNEVYGTTGIIKVRVTGKVGDSTRSLVADLKQTGFIDFLYFTDYEIGDPEVTNRPSCNVIHGWEETSWNDRDDCSLIRFADGDVIDGPLHTNDTIRTCGATFKGKVTTADPTANYDFLGYGDCASAPVWEQGPPVTDASIEMPDTNKDLARQTRTDLASEGVVTPGCLYTGPTEITLNSDGTMTVKSPWTKYTNAQGEDLSVGVTNNACGTISALRSSGGATVAVPENNVIYVQNIPTSGANGSSTSATTYNSSQCRQYASSGNGARISTNAVGYPKHSNERVPDSGTGADASYGCRNGDVFISGELSGTTLTVGAENYIYVVGDIRYDDADNDMLGLIGRNAVWVWNPMSCSSDCSNIGNYNALLTGASVVDRIDAAILSLEHTFMVQNYEKDPGIRGTLTVNGAIAQKFRGAVGASYSNGWETGYLKNYVYDDRFKYKAPPKFLSPVTSTYGVNIWIEISPVFSADGTYR
ncbi:hypothetical protein OH146_06035 [Salinibacterium sp. SYSU T00001]|uniref:hypothetical protein n=1 Tax=Homoserinimonas sedimenticola TaxID=2986805 RepID=UPI002236B5E2|nr:hypothetical protein [Salinibacterium sedimenticola]MCW4385331.1 hypothetical protein [Salinibacterium sedimenticola]